MSKNILNRFLYFSIYVALIGLYVTKNIPLSINSALENIASDTFFWTVHSDNALLFKVSLFLALIVNGINLLFINISGMLRIQGPNCLDFNKYIFIKIIAYSLIFIIGVDIFTLKISEAKNVRPDGFFYYPVVAALFAGIVNVWFDFFISIFNQVRKLK